MSESMMPQSEPKLKKPARRAARPAKRSDLPAYCARCMSEEDLEKVPVLGWMHLGMGEKARVESYDGLLCADCRRTFSPPPKPDVRSFSLSIEGETAVFNWKDTGKKKDYKARPKEKKDYKTKPKAAGKNKDEETMA